MLVLNTAVEFELTAEITANLMEYLSSVITTCPATSSKAWQSCEWVLCAEDRAEYKSKRYYRIKTYSRQVDSRCTTKAAGTPTLGRRSLVNQWHADWQPALEPHLWTLDKMMKSWTRTKSGTATLTWLPRTGGTQILVYLHANLGISREQAWKSKCCFVDITAAKPTLWRNQKTDFILRGEDMYMLY